MSNNNTNSGISVTGLLGVLFVGLKLGNVIDWPWLWVLSPFWIQAAFVLGFLLIAGLVVGLAKITEGVADKKAEKRRQARRAERLRNL
jgi:hypothetical protein